MEYGVRTDRSGDEMHFFVFVNIVVIVANYQDSGH